MQTHIHSHTDTYICYLLCGRQQCTNNVAKRLDLCILHVSQYERAQGNGCTVDAMTRNHKEYAWNVVQHVAFLSPIT